MEMSSTKITCAEHAGARYQHYSPLITIHTHSFGCQLKGFQTTLFYQIKSFSSKPRPRIATMKFNMSFFGGLLPVFNVDAPGVIASSFGEISAMAEALSPLLSKTASLYLPSDPEWNDLQVRGSSPRVQPNFDMVVEVGTEGDVQATVQVANQFNVSFLAVTGTHGWTNSLNDVSHGIQIRMRRLNLTTVDAGGKSATVQGGTLQHEITRALYPYNKQAVTGVCECVSVVGPLLAGGHSVLQARHGYALDNMISARVVLADGSIIEASEGENSDLFWALRGAGQNFGIVTSMVLKIYDIQRNWTVYTFIYSQDKIANLFELVNKVDADPKRPTSMFLFGVGTKIPDIDGDKPVIAYNVGIETSETEAGEWAQLFLEVGPVATEIARDVDYVSLYTVLQNNIESSTCRKEQNILANGASIPAWNVTALSDAFSIFNELTADSRYSTSVFLLENYGLKGVQEVDPASTSLSLEERIYPILTSAAIWWEGNKPQDAVDALAYASRIRQALAVQDERARDHTYVNYAVGGETIQQMYGHEDWRIERLLQLKTKYDSQNRFRFYNPLVKEHHAGS
ncbi:unnamed protein product [Periconia digitata]|uniref:FAD-binding PCMH-type domain-containing protein n=1 Tax=Periconia digitata TaxID=1303443 RepID=A0A9W4XD31_9PLEO|nr:unnamed protein product [Periconia digitata]